MVIVASLYKDSDQEALSKKMCVESMETSDACAGVDAARLGKGGCKDVAERAECSETLYSFLGSGAAFLLS